MNISGWGTTVVGGPTSDVLMKVTLDVISQRKCRMTKSSLTRRQLCTFTPGKDSCQVSHDFLQNLTSFLKDSPM